MSQQLFKQNLDLILKTNLRAGLNLHRMLKIYFEKRLKLRKNQIICIRYITRYIKQQKLLRFSKYCRK